ncbi:serine/threonine protein kinase [Isosphaera pallida ATCC 43644]|uniref:Serine/threonine protein kinase n=1 Tax=Isosphaera pallida (strain ATCC 43644 / DSM 9630 / IS1B) TaxID=575540 RepID=E8QWW1_ISOPI|nr:serine/threonine protein kinase [Isosphaera pallida]ADV64000.1 serine/threonine protein kinase [Isosphaera pallida ATCC 43644]
MSDPSLPNTSPPPDETDGEGNKTRTYTPATLVSESSLAVGPPQFGQPAETESAEQVCPPTISHHPHHPVGGSGDSGTRRSSDSEMRPPHWPAGMGSVGEEEEDQEGEDTVPPELRAILPGQGKCEIRLRYDKFRMLAHGKGGLGQVFIARDRVLNRRVAIKVIRPDSAGKMEGGLQEAYRRFHHEAIITGRLDHPGIVPVYALSPGRDSNDPPFYVMRLIQGRDLSKAIHEYHRLDDLTEEQRRERRVKFHTLLTQFVSICNTIAYAHSKRVIHRDLKPRNIMLGKFDETLVVDWGLAQILTKEQVDGLPDQVQTVPLTQPELEKLIRERATSLSATGEGSSPASQPAPPRNDGAGTLPYMSPEQITGQPLTPASDLYALGTILFEILTGRPPYLPKQQGVDRVIEAIPRGDFPCPRQLKPGIAPALEAICLKAMKVQPEDRYRSAKELADEVERFLADEKVHAYAEPRWERLGRWSRRHRGATVGFGLGLVVVALVAIMSAGFLNMLANREAEARAQAEQSRERLMVLSARLAAKNVGSVLEEHLRVLEQQAADEELRRLMTDFAREEPPPNLPAPPIKPDRIAALKQGVLGKLDEWIGYRIDKIKDQLPGAQQRSGKKGIDSCVIFDAAGRQLARVPDDPRQLGNTFFYRDHFHGSGQDMLPNQVGSERPRILFSHISIPYRSANDRRLKIAFSTPIYANNEARANRDPSQILGTLAMTLPLGYFAFLEDDLNGTNQSVMIINLGNDQLAPNQNDPNRFVEPQQGLVLHHREIEARNDADADEPIFRIDDRTLKLFKQYRRSSDGDLSNGLPNLLPDFVNPLHPEHPPQLAAFEEVLLPKRALNHFHWFIVIQRENQ